jgi:hypothetical protein
VIGDDIVPKGRGKRAGLAWQSHRHTKHSNPSLPDLSHTRFDDLFPTKPDEPSRATSGYHFGIAFSALYTGNGSQLCPTMPH